MSASWEMALADIAAAGQQIERNDVMSAGVGQSDGRRDLAAALGHLFAGGDKGKARTVFTVRAFLVLAYLLIDAAVATLKGAGR